MPKISSFRDLRVYQSLKSLHLELHKASLKFPKLEMYELGSQLRRSSNAAPAILAEGWGSRHTNIYLEAINRAMGEIRESQHHVDIAKEKGYITPPQFADYDDRYDHCARMLEKLHQSLIAWEGTKRSGHMIKETTANYETARTIPWEVADDMTYTTLNEEPPHA